MTTITIITVKEVTRLEKTERVVQKVRVLEKVTVSKGLNSLRCNAHNGPIGPQRPIFLVWADEVPFRICYDCGKHLLGDSDVRNEDVK